MISDNDGYYQDLDEARGWDEIVEEEYRDSLRASREARTAKNRAIRKEVEKQLKAAGIQKPVREIRGAKVEVNCLTCKSAFTARVADRKRGWAKYCSKSCKAKKQTNWSRF
ncbi:hypothetical protein [Alteromonas mediterranea]|jgi:NAD-dependent SIR2 family protein deacetylase|uniref:Uncharacterized protein n=1 Tax=Alteromonas mediterranea TaxID=314275 RepID=A0AAC8XK95_9ALTE|nr:hypothetical protein [Alteromonas mediterranea]AFV85233.1 hypothetical protein amad1_08610 [Alteromonas mediterranea DE1]AGP97244.1 hypothetical protein I635_08600 [Alteromonas mediterranea UM7]AMJ78329.1 hypothetical protein AV942_08515 [Alteromonas mediterranea]AMJ82478.1 hypothetical protein AV941_08550 [Alteromonas mediterranea]